jgi:hypothetical protein
VTNYLILLGIGLVFGAIHTAVGKSSFEVKLKVGEDRIFAKKRNFLTWLFFPETYHHSTLDEWKYLDRFLHPTVLDTPKWASVIFMAPIWWLTVVFLAFQHIAYDVPYLFERFPD